MSPILVLFQSFFSLCLFKARPQDFPAAGVLLFICSFGYLIASSLLAYPGHNIFTALLAGMTETVLLLLITRLLLILRKVPERWLQSAIALSGSGLIFSVMVIPLLYWRVGYTDPASPSAIFGILVLSILIWNIAVMAHILRHALSSSFALGVIVALGYVWLITQTVLWVAPAQGNP